jgi:hypothetical protein
MDRFPYHRLCEMHHSALPLNPITTDKSSDHGTLASEATSCGFVYSAERQIDIMRIDPELAGTSKDAEMCKCLISKTMICSNCLEHATNWQMEQLKLFERSGIVECAYKRFPGGCKSQVPAKCACGGRGIGCSFISERDWEKFEATDLLWIGRTGLANCQFEKKEKKDLREFFGDNFPIRPPGATIVPVRGPTCNTVLQEPGLALKKAHWASGLLNIHRSRSLLLLRGSTKKNRSICDTNCTESISSEEFTAPLSKGVKISDVAKSFLINPQMRKPIGNFRVNANTMQPPPPMRHLGGATPDSNSDRCSSLSDEADHSDHSRDGYASIADSISTLGSEYDYDACSTAGLVTGKDLIAVSPSVRIGTASVATRSIAPRLVEMRSLLSSPVSIVNNKTMPQEKWGCRERVDLSNINMKSAKAHGFWRCSFCNGKIHGV